MSITAILSHPWSDPSLAASQAEADASFSITADQDSSGTAASPAASFGQLASDIQAMLIQSQSTNPQTASVDPTDSVGRTQHHHHNQHHGDDGDASGATAVASNDSPGSVTRAMQSYGAAAAMIPALSL